jgi:hypothetical protein
MAQPSHGLSMGRKTDIVRHIFPQKKSLISQA